MDTQVDPPLRQASQVDLLQVVISIFVGSIVFDILYHQLNKKFNYYNHFLQLDLDLSKPSNVCWNKGDTYIAPYPIEVSEDGICRWTG